MSKNMNVLLTTSLFGSAILSLLVFLALVLILVLRQKERKDHDDKKILPMKARTMKEFGHLTPSTKIRRLQQSAKHKKRPDTSILASETKKKKRAEASAAAVSASAMPAAEAAEATVAAATKPSSSKASTDKSPRDNQLSLVEKLKKSQEVSRWREEHDKMVSGRRSHLLTSPPPTFKSDETSSGSSDLSSP